MIPDESCETVQLAVRLLMFFVNSFVRSDKPFTVLFTKLGAILYGLSMSSFTVPPYADICSAFYFPLTNIKRLNIFTRLSLLTGPEELSSFGTVFQAETSRGFAERHLWLSVWDRPSRSRFSRVQRVACCLTLTYSFMCANVMW